MPQQPDRLAVAIPGLYPNLSTLHRWGGWPLTEVDAARAAQNPPGLQGWKRKPQGSIFRLHVGNALLRSEDQALPTWGVGSVAPQALRESEAARAAEAALERRVSMVIGAMLVLWVDVPDDPSPDSERSAIERGSIAMLSNGLAPHAPPSAGWLGHSSARHEIRASGLWNLRHVEEAVDPSFLDVLERTVTR